MRREIWAGAGPCSMVMDREVSQPQRVLESRTLKALRVQESRSVEGPREQVCSQTMWVGA